MPLRSTMIRPSCSITKSSLRFFLPGAWTMSVGSSKLPIGVSLKPPLPSPTGGSAWAAGVSSRAIALAAANPMLSLRLALNPAPWPAGS
jgi:hypothetical protein